MRYFDEIKKAFMVNMQSKYVNLFPTVSSYEDFKKYPFSVHNTDDWTLQKYIEYTGENGFTVPYYSAAYAAEIKANINGLKPNTNYTISCDVAQYTGNIYKLLSSTNTITDIVDGKLLKVLTTDDDGVLFTTGTAETNFVKVLYTHSNASLNITSPLVLSNIMLLEGVYTRDTLPKFVAYR